MRFMVFVLISVQTVVALCVDLLPLQSEWCTSAQVHFGE